MNHTQPKRFDGFTIFLVILTACSIVAPVALLGARYNIAAVSCVIVVFAIWTFIGRKYYPSGFHFFFDFLSMQVILAGLIVVCVAAYRWIAPWFAA